MPGNSLSALRSPSDPLARIRRRALWTWAAAAPVLAACGWWASRPLPHVARATSAVEIAASAPARRDDPFDLRPFQTARLWVDPAGSAAAGDAELAAKAASAVRLQLLGITSEGTGLVACLYDPDTDKIVLLRDGDRMGAHTVGRVSAREVAFRGADGELRLSLARTDR